MNKEEAQLVIQRIDKVLGKSVQKEEVEEVQLDEALPIPGAVLPSLGAFVRGHRIINQYMLLAMTVFPKGTTAHKIVALFQKPLGAFVNAMDEFYSKHKILFGLLFGTMLALDVFGTSAVVAKEKFLQILRKQIAKTYDLEDAGAPKPPEMPKIDTSKAPPPPSSGTNLQEQLDRMKDLAGIKKVL